MKKDIGILAMEIYFPSTYVSQAQLQKHQNVSTGKYTIGLGQEKLAFTYPFQDINSISLTVVSRLLKKNNIDPAKIGRLQVGTQTLVDKSKSTKTHLMSLFKGNHDIQGATSINACYGATNALFNALNWISSQYWDGRYAIVVSSDIAVYQKGPARPTGGAGAIALLIGLNANIIFQPLRSTYVDHQYDFYKPNPNSQYPIVDGNLSINCYLQALEACVKGLKLKYQNIGQKFDLQNYSYFCFHSPFHKMVQKAFTKLMQIHNNNLKQEDIKKIFKQKVQPSMLLSKNLGNIYTGSLYSGLISLICQKDLENKKVLLFSYGSGLMASMFSVRIKQNLSQFKKNLNIHQRLQNRIEISAAEYERVMLQKEKSYGKYFGKLNVNFNLLENSTYYLSQIDFKWRRIYQKRQIKDLSLSKNQISSKSAMNRIQRLNIQLKNDEFSGFYKLSVHQRMKIIAKNLKKQTDISLLQSGGIDLEKANLMIQNVIGKISLPLAVAPNFMINNKNYTIPMCIEQPSIVAACSSIAKMLYPYSFYTSSTQNIMIGQIHLPDCQKPQIHLLLQQKHKIVKYLNSSIQTLINRGGGVQDFRIRQLDTKQYVAQILVNVCQAMGANIVNTLCQRLKLHLINMTKGEMRCGIAVLSNYCNQRMSMSWFQIPVKDMHWKGVDGQQVAKRILQAYDFARLDKFRACTHNKGVLNGIDSVCIATGQDFRAIQSAAHLHATKTGKYMPLTHYQIIQRNQQYYFKGSLQLPISIGTVGGALQKNPLYKVTMEILQNPNSKMFAEILATIGLAQNFGALRALAIQGIQKGHMALHSRSVAVKAGVPLQMMDEACKFMTQIGKYDETTAKLFLENKKKSSL